MTAQEAGGPTKLLDVASVSAQEHAGGRNAGEQDAAAGLPGCFPARQHIQQCGLATPRRPHLQQHASAFPYGLQSSSRAYCLTTPIAGPSHCGMPPPIV